MKTTDCQPFIKMPIFCHFRIQVLLLLENNTFFEPKIRNYLYNFLVRLLKIGLFIYKDSSLQKESMNLGN